MFYFLDKNLSFKKLYFIFARNITLTLYSTGVREKSELVKCIHKY
jgi:hypothetical protein